MCNWGRYLYICPRGCPYGRARLPAHSEKVFVCRPCDFAKDWAGRYGIILEDLLFGVIHAYCCIPGGHGSVMDPDLDSVQSMFCPRCLDDIEQLSSSDEEGRGSAESAK